MFKKHLYQILGVLVVLSFVLVACQPAAPATEAPAVEAPAQEATAAPVQEEAPTEAVAEAPTEGECALKVGYVSDVGKINDQSFNQASWTGVENGAKALGLSEDCYSFIETVDSADYEANIRSFVNEGYNVIVTSGFAMGTITRQIAKENPDVYFIGVDQQQGLAGRGDALHLADGQFAFAGDANPGHHSTRPAARPESSAARARSAAARRLAARPR